ncbi:MAG: leucine-rich repeat protein [Clostridiales bacterium]|nr:leucine-rich repeat protein [Clostridiales bacterium]
MKMFDYEILDDGTLRLTFFHGLFCLPQSQQVSRQVVIPADIDGHPVSIIGSWLFEDERDLVKITLPEGITTIESGAFRNCRSLEEINLPESITSIGEEAFYQCLNLKRISLPENLPVIENRTFFRCLELESITIPDSVTKIASNAFLLCRRLSKLVIPERVSEIGDRAFSICTCLTDVTFPNHEIRLGERAFAGCVCLKNIRWSADLLRPYLESDVFLKCYTLTSRVYQGEYVYEITGDADDRRANLILYIGTGSRTMLPESIDGYPVAQICTKLFANVFHSFSYQSVALEEICVQKDKLSYASRDGVLYNRDFSTLICYPDGKKDSFFRVPDSVTQIGEAAFSHCPYLMKVELPPALKEISKGAFAYCESLWHVSLSNGVTTIGDYAFSETNLKNIDIPDSVSCLAENALKSYASGEYKITEAVLTEADDPIRREKGLSVPEMILNGLKRKEAAWEKRHEPFMSTSYGQVTFKECDYYPVVTAGIHPKSIEFERYGSCATVLGSELVIYCPEPVRVTDETVSEWLAILSRPSLSYIHFQHLFDTSGLTTIGRTFSGTSLERIDDDWDLDLSGVRDLSEMFSGCSELYKADLRQMNFSGATTLRGMFCDCGELYSVNMRGMDLHQVKDLSEMFLNCVNLCKVDFSYADLSNVENLAHMFEDCRPPVEVNWTGTKLPQGISVSNLFDDEEEL